MGNEDWKRCHAALRCDKNREKKSDITLKKMIKSSPWQKETRMAHSMCCYITGTMSIKYIKYLFNNPEALKRWNVHKTTPITLSHLLLLFLDKIF